MSITHEEHFLNDALPVFQKNAVSRGGRNRLLHFASTSEVVETIEQYAKDCEISTSDLLRRLVFLGWQSLATDEKN